MASLILTWLVLGLGGLGFKVLGPGLDNKEQNQLIEEINKDTNHWYRFTLVLLSGFMYVDSTFIHPQFFKLNVFQYILCPNTASAKKKLKSIDLALSEYNIRKALLSYSLSIWFPAPLWLLLNYLHFSFLQKISKERNLSLDEAEMKTFS